MGRWWTAGVAVAALVGAPRPAPAAPEADAARLDVLIVADTTDPEIGATTRIDLEAVRGAVEAGVPAGKRTVTVLEGASALPERILAHYDALAPGPETSLLFYYSGHGAWADPGHYLRMNGGKILERTRLLSAMQAKNPRLLVLLTDCCSVYVGKTALFAIPAPDPDVFRDLFFRHRGVVDVTAAKRGQEAVGDQMIGGFFTHALVASLTTSPRAELDTRRDGIVTWDEVTAQVAKATAEAFRRSHPRGLVVKGKTLPGQNPHVFAVGAPPAAPIAPSVRLGVQGTPSAAGLVLTAISDRSPAQWIELRPGDRLVSIRVADDQGGEQNLPTRTVEELDRALAAAPGPRLVTLLVTPAKGGDPEERWVRLGP